MKAQVSRAKKDPDEEPFAFPSGYITAIRNPTALTIVGALLLFAGLAFVGIVIRLVVDPIGKPLSDGFVALAALLPIAFGFVLWTRIVRLRWQRAYFRRHGHMPVLIGQGRADNGDEN
jgi:hypothetical protein